MLDEDEDGVHEYAGNADDLLSELAGDDIGWETDDYSLTRENYREIYENAHPRASQWKDGVDSSCDDVFATVNEGCDIMWNQAKQEIKVVKARIKSLFGTDSPKMFDFYNLLFGPRSRLGRLLQEKLDLSAEELSKNLGVLFLTSAYNVSKTQIFDRQSLINHEGLATDEEYQNFWNTIADSGVKTGDAIHGMGDVARTRGAKPLWIEVEAALNDTCRELFIEGFDGFLRIILDDDKMHDASKQPEAYGLKKSQHVRDNRTGCTLHTLAYTATGLPIGFAWERANDDSVTGATERLIRSQFAPMHGDSGPPNLVNTLFAMDRGYLQPRLFYDYLIPSGAEIMGTIRRCPMFPFTFEQVLKPTDLRQDVPTKGMKTLLLKNIKVSGKQVSGSA